MPLAGFLRWCVRVSPAKITSGQMTKVETKGAPTMSHTSCWPVNGRSSQKLLEIWWNLARRYRIYRKIFVSNMLIKTLHLLSFKFCVKSLSIPKLLSKESEMQMTKYEGTLVHECLDIGRCRDRICIRQCIRQCTRRLSHGGHPSHISTLISLISGFT